MRPGQLLAGAGLVLLTACTSPLPPAPADGLDWETRRAQLLAIDNWSLRGRLNLRGEGRSDTVNLSWDQRGETFEILLSGRIGLGAVRISGDGGGVLVERAGEEPRQAPDLAALGEDLLGYRFPAGQLMYWLRGVDAPRLREDYTLDQEQRLASLRQDGWELSYEAYGEVDGVALPSSLSLAFPPWRLKVAIHEWTVEP